MGRSCIPCRRFRRTLASAILASALLWHLGGTPGGGNSLGLGLVLAGVALVFVSRLLRLGRPARPRGIGQMPVTRFRSESG